MITWDPTTAQENHRREVSIAAALLREADESTDVEAVRRLVRAATMRLEALAPWLLAPGAGPLTT